MAKRPSRSHRASGFSMVEMLVALVFTLVLMAGMATVFKASLGAFYTSGEVLSGSRRNRMSIDQLGDDLNTACMELIDPMDDLPVSASNPSFYVMPNMAIPGAPATASPGLPTTADQLFFFMDQAMPFTAFLNGPGGPNASQLVQSGALPTAANSTFAVNCNSSTYANQVVAACSYNNTHTPPLPPLAFIFKDTFGVGYISGSPSVAGDVVTVVAGASPNAGATGIGSTGLPTNANHLSNGGIVFVQPAQMVRYSVAYLSLDPNSANTLGVPCLVRDQGNYSSAGFVADQPQQIVSENIAGFKVYLSVNSGQSWAGLATPARTYSGFASGWTGGLLAELTNQLGGAGQPGAEITTTWTTPSGVQATNLAANPDWFRFIPTLVRADITTRTAAERTEYSSAANTAAYRLLTQSLVFVPRHSGLTPN